MSSDLLQKEREMLTDLLNQYKKERSDLQDGKGIGVTIATNQVYSYLMNLSAHIRSLENYLKYDLRIDELKFELDKMIGYYENASFGLESGDGTTNYELNSILNKISSIKNEIEKLKEEKNKNK